MAQHIPVEQFEDKTIQRIAQAIRNQQYFETSFKFERMPWDYEESPTDKVYVAHRNVPQSIVAGGRASFEVHTRPQGSKRIVTNIYLVA